MNAPPLGGSKSVLVTECPSMEPDYFATPIDLLWHPSPTLIAAISTLIRDPNLAQVQFSQCKSLNSLSLSSGIAANSGSSRSKSARNAPL